MKFSRSSVLLLENTKRMCGSGSLKALFVLCFFAFALNAQELPDRIRGYKVHKAEITVGSKSASAAEDKDLRVEMELDEPEVAEIGLTGVTLTLGGEMTVFGQSGTVDFITFKDFVVGGIKVDVEEYNESFEFKKNERLKLTKPVEIFVPVTQALSGIYGEYSDPKDKWRVTGRVFVFGRFNKMGFRFRRVIPVDVEMMIDNPLK